MFVWTMIILLCAIPHIRGLAVDNNVVGQPLISCSDSGVTLAIRTRNPFTGRIFVKGSATKQACTTAARGVVSDALNPSFMVRFDQCGMLRDRMLNPRGMMYTIVMIVSFHPIFITKVDKAYAVQCFYGEVTKTLTQSIDVSMMATTALTNSVPMPACSYTIRSQTPDGPIVQFANIGDKIVHRWDCDTDMYKFLIKNCYVEDGNNNRVPVIDKDGCTIDAVVLSDVRYEANRPIAFAQSHQFKFADLSRLYFACQIELCLIMDTNCLTVTPPRCPASGQQTAVRARRMSANETSRPDKSHSSTSEEMDVRSAAVTVLDIDQSLDKLLATSWSYEQGRQTAALASLPSSNRVGTNDCEFSSLTAVLISVFVMVCLCVVVLSLYSVSMYRRKLLAVTTAHYLKQYKSVK